MRKLIAVVAAAISLAAVGAATADPTHGHCTAYFNGSENGRAHKRQATAFQEFVNYVGDNDGVDNDGDDAVDEGDEVASEVDVWNFCMDNGGVGGQPEDPTNETPEGNGRNGRGRG